MARVIATGKSDFPNQINNMLAFPGVMRGLLDARASTVNNEMKLAAATAIAGIVGPDELNEDYVIPSVFNRRVAGEVAKAVVKAAQSERRFASHRAREFVSHRAHGERTEKQQRNRTFVLSRSGFLQIPPRLCVQQRLEFIMSQIRLAHDEDLDLLVELERACLPDFWRKNTLQ